MNSTLRFWFIICDVGPRNLMSQLNFHYHHFQKNLLFLLSYHSPFSISLQALVTTNLHSVSICLPILDISYKWIQTHLGLLAPSLQSIWLPGSPYFCHDLEILARQWAWTIVRPALFVSTSQGPLSLFTVNYCFIYFVHFGGILSVWGYIWPLFFILSRSLLFSI